MSEQARLETERRVKDALRTVREKSNNEYAKSYADAGMGMTGHGLYVQVLYVLSNLAHWRGEEARATKDVLKRFKA